MCQAGSEKDQEDSEKSPSALILSTNYRYSANLRAELTALTRLLPMWPGFESRKQRQRRVEFVVGSTHCYKMFFSDYWFSIPLKTNVSKFQKVCYFSIIRYLLFIHLGYVAVHFISDLILLLFFDMFEHFLFNLET